MSQAADDAELLASAAVALNRHAVVLRGLGALFEAAGHGLYLVGGPVRDALLGRPSRDLDFTTDARPEQVQQIVRAWADAVWDTGIEFGTVGVGKDGHRLEITTFRADRYDQVSRNPEVHFGDRLDDDLVRRDFTVNAMAVRITPTGPANSSIRSAVWRRCGHACWTPRPRPRCRSVTTRCGCCARRGSSRSSASPSPPRVRTAIEEMAPQLDRITAERVAAELDKLLLGAGPGRRHRPAGGDRNG